MLSARCTLTLSTAVSTAGAHLLAPHVLGDRPKLFRNGAAVPPFPAFSGTYVMYLPRKSSKSPARSYVLYVNCICVFVDAACRPGSIGGDREQLELVTRLPDQTGTRKERSGLIL